MRGRLTNLSPDIELLLYYFIQDQSIKLVAAAQEAPTQMFFAFIAQRDAPPVAVKPRVFAGWNTHMCTPRCLLETTDFECQVSGIGASMLMCTLLFYF